LSERLGACVSVSSRYAAASGTAKRARSMRFSAAFCQAPVHSEHAVAGMNQVTTEATTMFEPSHGCHTPCALLSTPFAHTRLSYLLWSDGYASNFAVDLPTSGY
jgi:hypothetical protein